MRFRPTVIGLVVVFAVALVSCSVEGSLAAPSCSTGESALIVAQSVPGAERVPCLGPLPTGWAVDAVRVDEDGTRIRLDSDRAGTGAAELHYSTTCDVSRAVSVPSEFESVEAFEYIEQLAPSFRGERYFTFTDGCVWWRFDFDDDVSAALSIELGNSLDLVARDVLNENLRENFVDEEL